MNSNKFIVINHKVDFSKNNADAVQDVVKMVSGFFYQGEANEGRAINPHQSFSNPRMFEIAFQVIAGFCEEGSSVVVASAENPYEPAFRFIVKNGKVVKEMPRVVWEAAKPVNSGNNNQGNNSGGNNNNQGGNNQNNNSGNNNQGNNNNQK